MNENRTPLEEKNENVKKVFLSIICKNGDLKVSFHQVGRQIIKIHEIDEDNKSQEKVTLHAYLHAFVKKHVFLGCFC